MNGLPATGSPPDAPVRSRARRFALILAAVALAVAWPVSAAREDPYAPPAFAYAAAAEPGAAPPGAPVYKPDPPSAALVQEFLRKNYKWDRKSGNYLSPAVFSKTLNEELAPVFINGKYVRDLKGQPVFLRESIRTKLLEADEAMFQKKHEHVIVTYGFRSNAVQQELFRKIAGKGKVAPAGGSFHETGMALDLANWKDAQNFMIDAGFVGGCHGIEEDFVHYSVGEITKAGNFTAFKRCTLKNIPKQLVKGVKKVGSVTVGVFKKDKNSKDKKK